jgi:molecular chaperone GrpE
MSDDTEKNDEKTDVNVDFSEGAEEAGDFSEDALREELNKAKNEYLYLRAEFDNYRRQATKERSELIRFAGERLAKDLLDTLDIFDSALAAEVTETNFKNFVSGIELTAQQLRSTLAKHQIIELPSQGVVFDPNLHEALSSEVTSAVPAGHVSRVFKKAYKFHDKIIRPAQVVVAKEKE